MTSGNLSFISYSVATELTCGGKHDKSFYGRFLAESKDERTLKIGKHLLKL